MAEKVFLRHEQINQHIVQKLRVTVRGIILDDDALQFGKALLDLGMIVMMLMGKFVDVHLRIGLHSRHEVGHISVDVLVLIVHVAAHFCGKLIIKLQDKEGYLVACRTVDGLDELAADGRKPELHEIIVRTAQISHQGRERQRVHRVGHIDRPPVGADKIHHRQESGCVHARRLARLGHRVVAKSQAESKPTDHLQDPIIITDDVPHVVGFFVFLRHDTSIH